MQARRYGIIPKDSMVTFLERAYKSDVVRCALTERVSHGAKITAISPLRGHLTKDGRLMIGYRVQTFHPKYGTFDFPVFFHNVTHSHAAALQAYKQLQRDSRGDKHNLLNRQFFRAADMEFIAAFPLDPEMRSAMRLLKAGELLDAYNSELRSPNDDVAVAIKFQLLGYRPERRVVLKLDVTNADSTTSYVLKLYRRQEAERVWQHCQALKPYLKDVPGITSPIAYSPTYGGLLYPFRQVDSLHDMLERGWATTDDIRLAGSNLRRLHDCIPTRGQYDTSLRQFSFADEWEILNRWRRFLKHGGLKEAGYLAKYVRLLDPDKMPTFEVGLIHRDFYPRQLLVNPWTREQALVDIDTMTVGPRALDVGNFLAHLHLHSEVLGDKALAMREAFLQGYGDIAREELVIFELTSVVRLFSLALVSPNPRPMADHLRRLAKQLERELERILA